MYASTAGLQMIGSIAPVPEAIGMPRLSRVSIALMYSSAEIVYAKPCDAAFSCVVTAGEPSTPWTRR